MPSRFAAIVPSSSRAKLVDHVLKISLRQLGLVDEEPLERASRRRHGEREGIGIVVGHRESELLQKVRVAALAVRAEHLLVLGNVARGHERQAVVGDRVRDRRIVVVVEHVGDRHQGPARAMCEGTRDHDRHGPGPVISRELVLAHLLQDWVHERPLCCQGALGLDGVV